MAFIRTRGEKARPFVRTNECVAAKFGDVLFDPRVDGVDGTFETGGRVVCRMCHDMSHTFYIGREVTSRIENPIEFYGDITDPAGNPIAAVELDRRAHAQIIRRLFKNGSPEPWHEIWYRFAEQTCAVGPAIADDADRSFDAEDDPMSSPSRAQYGFEIHVS
ncbi:MAG: hypothetical protein WC700_07655 [Gemmatimonadaceae bacterium]|jgi:hypothetical protein